MKDAEVTKSDIGEVILVGGKYILGLANFEGFGKIKIWLKYLYVYFINFR